MKDFTIELTEEEWKHVIWHLYHSGDPCEVRDKICTMLAEKGMDVLEE